MSFDAGLTLGLLLGGNSGQIINQFNGSLRAVLDSSGSLKIVIGETLEGETDEAHTDFEYSYQTFNFVKEIRNKTVITGADGSVTTTESVQKFEQLIITSLYDGNGKLLMRTDYNEETGDIYGFYDRDNNPIYVTEWRS